MSIAWWAGLDSGFCLAKFASGFVCVCGQELEVGVPKIGRRGKRGEKPVNIVLCIEFVSFCANLRGYVRCRFVCMFGEFCRTSSGQATR